MLHDSSQSCQFVNSPAPADLVLEASEIGNSVNVWL